MKRIAFGLVLLAFVAGPVRVHAEDKDNPYVKTREMLKKESEEADREYQRTLKATRGADPAPAKADPWSNMRGSNSASQDSQKK